MTRLERVCLDFIQKHIFAFVCVACFLLSVLWRSSMWEARSQDYLYDFSFWVQQLQSEGLAQTLRSPISNYSPLHTVVLWLFTQLSRLPLTSVKLMSTAFDFANVALLVLLAQAICPEQHRKTGMVTAFCLGCLLPVPVLNSAFWGQCDAMYAAFLLASLLCLVHGREPVAVVLCGVALCFKLQALFFLPVLIMVYVARRSFSALWFAALPGAVLLSGIPTALAGGSLLVGFSIYQEQADLYKSLTMNYPNIYSFAQWGEYELLATGGIVAAMVLLGAMLAYVLHCRAKVQGKALVLLSVWCTLVCTMLLPAMHERYAFFAEIAIWIYCIAQRDWRSICLAAAMQAVTLVTYANYFWGWQGVPGWVLTLVNCVVLALLTRRLVQLLRPQEQTVLASMFAASQEETTWL